ncbi:cell division cycle-associated protein 3 isoform X1 [Cricetulus griseus]|uniref:Cell division cycle associated 3 n=1 Tax=Cricetulus griseus TaxID=10029 RepID=G3GUP6_CRIGR|nr:cell division cycle-associated protein 3 isoform X1 [Cricetulus griseus]XP_007644921.1 cell division cycle-associated protein 3 isoform X1 [Cricetulus griseus]XP_007644927.1 cell division cycle-associated protein 3 isoform X1 [Cricetulus griseus]XP_027284057.1 cell division cycle-associated protein 3 isoform X1 [Cricetulus griseus]XP_027284058.1 cell division cycle-associated protein 3 isoform X1 [Cricetulus griseus]XP_027284059.1 cell division cycle-associated protein 3 isoform X1 [Cricetu
MGSTQSISGTPARPLPHNKHLARVADPRSPSAGIQRTPIQVESSPQPSLSTEELSCPKQAQDPDPRSPTLGIARTPMKISGTDPPSSLVKELSEEFETEASKSIYPTELALPQQTLLSSELDLPLDSQLSLEDQLLPWSQIELPSKQVFTKEEAKQSTELIIASQNSDKPSRDPETPQSSGSKLNRRKANSKVLGRSPLTILQDDNSPGALTLRQGKRPSPLSENGKDLKEGVILGTGRLLKTGGGGGGGAWEQSQDHDKENQHFALMES